jgi:predicted nucleotidyltransferase component of viral defense system
MIGDDHKLTKGYVARHVPPRSGLGTSGALIDIAQDFLLTHLAEQGLFDIVTFKGGTALRKLFAGAQGRFSTDLDLAANEVGADREAIAALVADTCNVKIGPFTFAALKDRGRWSIAVHSDLGTTEIRIKLDVGPPCWLEREHRGFVTTPIHARYGFVLPILPSMRLEEILAEKVSRLTRLATARDASDLLWAARTSPYSQFDRNAVRRLALVKIWVDNNGLQPDWDRAIAATPFDANVWFGTGRAWDDEQIGMLTIPPPSLTALESGLKKHYSWLTPLSAEEKRWGSGDPRHRAEVLSVIKDLDDGALQDAYLY